MQFYTFQNVILETEILEIIYVMNICTGWNKHKGKAQLSLVMDKQSRQLHTTNIPKPKKYPISITHATLQNVPVLYVWNP